ncbi:ArnT family glycosyltransferase [Thermodesulfobacteriota bacterium]
MFDEKAISIIKKILLASLAILIVSILLLSLVPPISKDALVHHLALPKLYLKHGEIFEIPFMGFSYYPMNLDLLYMIPLYFGNDIVPKFIHFGFGLLAAFLIYCFLNKRTNQIYGLLGALLFLSTPIILKLSISVYVDLGEIFFSFAVLFFIFEWLRKELRLKYLIIAGVMCGLAVGTKYTGLVTLFIFTLFVPFLYSRSSRGKKADFFKSVGHGVLFLLISLIVFSPWAIRNYHWKGNPIYPLYNNVFNPPKSIKTNSTPKIPRQKQNRGFLTYRSMAYNEPLWYIALLPIRVFFEGRDGDPQFFDGKLNPFLLVLPFFAFMGMKNDPEYLKVEKKALLGFSALFFCFALFSAVLRIRYISTIIPPLIILTVFGIQTLLRKLSSFSSLVTRRVGIAVVVILLLFMVLLNASYITEQFEYVKPFSYHNGSLSRDEYISIHRPEYSAMEFINHNTENNAKIYFIFMGKRGYYCDREYVFNIGIIKGLISKANKPEEILVGLERQGFTHVLIHYRLFDKWLKDNFSEEKILLAQQFFRENLSTLFVENGFGVLSLRGI